MKADDYDRFARAIGRMVLAFDKKLTEARIDLYWERLKDVPIEVLEESVPILIEQLVSFPKVAQVRRACDEAERKRQWRADQYTPPADGSAFCEACEDTGWIRGTMYVDIYGKDVACVRPCECRKGNPVYRAKLGAAQNALKPEGKYQGHLFDRY